MSAYEEFTGKSVEEALRNARDAFGVGLNDLDFEILTPGSRGVLGMGAEPARIVAAPRSALGGQAPKREAAESSPLPPPPPRERDAGYDQGRDRGPRDRGRPDRAPSRGNGGQRTTAGGPPQGDRGGYRAAPTHGPAPRRDDRRGAPDGGERPRGGSPLSPAEI